MRPAKPRHPASCKPRIAVSPHPARFAHTPGAARLSRQKYATKNCRYPVRSSGEARGIRKSPELICECEARVTKDTIHRERPYEPNSAMSKQKMAAPPDSSLPKDDQMLPG